MSNLNSEITLREINQLIQELENNHIQLLPQFDLASDYLLDSYCELHLKGAAFDDWVIVFFVDGGGLDYIQRIRVKFRATLEYAHIPEVVHNHLFELLHRKLYPPSTEELAATHKRLDEAMHNLARGMAKSVLSGESPLYDYLKGKGYLKSWQ